MENENEPLWLNSVEANAWRGWLYSGMAAVGNIDDDLKEATGLSLLDYHVLVIASEAGETGARMKDFALGLLLSKSHATFQIKKMESVGLVAREQSPSDKRVWLVRLTERGKATLEAAAPKHVRHVRNRVLDILSESDLADLARISKKILDANFSQAG